MDWRSSDVEELAGTICGPALAQTLAPDLHSRTGGHPLFVRELARLSGAGVRGELPTAVTGAVTRRLETLPGGAADAFWMQPVCSATDSCPTSSASVVDEPGDRGRQPSGAAQEAGVIRTGTGDELWFTHDLFRETLYGQLSLAEQAGLHGGWVRHSKARDRRGARVSPGDLARHFAQAVTATDPAKAIYWAREAARDERRTGRVRVSPPHTFAERAWPRLTWGGRSTPTCSCGS